MRTKKLYGTLLLAGALALTTGCDDDAAFVPGGGSGGFRIVWPTTTAPVQDASTFAMASFPFTTTQPVTFSATIDGGAEIAGLRDDSDSLIAFPLNGLTDGSHTITVRSSTGAVLNRVFEVSLVARPTITDVTPDTAVLGANQQITITGTGFVTSLQGMRVYLNGVQLPITQTPTATQIIATVQGTGLRTGLLSVAVATTPATRRISRELIPFRIVGGTPPPADQPRILLADPNAAPRSAPVVIYGKNIGSDAIPFFGSLRSSPILPLGSQSLGLNVGLVEFGLTFVPPLALTQDGIVTVETQDGTSTGFPFFIR